MYDVLEIVPDIGVPLPKAYKYSDLKERVDAACNSAIFLIENGAQYDSEPTQQDKEAAANLASQYADNEEVASKKIKNGQLTKLTPQAVVFAAGILDEYGHKVAESASQIRDMVTTKLISETENADPRVRLKALELLGKISDVGLFSEKTEVTVTHQTSDELKAKLKDKLEKLINPPPAADAVHRAKQIAREEQNRVIEADPDLDFEDITPAVPPVGEPA